MSSLVRVALLVAAIANVVGCSSSPVATTTQAPPIASSSGAPTPTSTDTCSASLSSSSSSYPANALPDSSWDGIDDKGVSRTLSLHDWYDPCSSSSSRLLVVRVDGGAWCGTCRWHAAHTSELRALITTKTELRFLDLVIGNQDNAPAQASDLPAWRALVDKPEGIAFGADPSFAFRSIGPEGGVPLPLYVFIETKGMTVRDWLSNPGPETLASKIETIANDLAGNSEPPPPPRDEAQIDGFFRRDEWDLLRDVTLPSAPPLDPTNAVADHADAAALGKSLFFDANLSPSGTVACATCHAPDKRLSDDLPTAKGIAIGSRHTPRIALASFSRWQFWDGRADSLWSQALGPLENPIEMASSRGFVANAIATRYAADYATAFPDAPPPQTNDVESITRTFVNVGKAIAAYERTFRVAPNALDRYVGGDTSALTLGEKQGLSLFTRVGCMQCHWGPRLTDDAFHVTRVGSGRVDGSADRGRIDGIDALLKSEFGVSSRFSDNAPDTALLLAVTSSSPSMLGAFKTPSLRGIAGSSAFGHGGTEHDLVSVTELYGERGLAADDPHTTGTIEPWLMRFDVTAQWALAPFLQKLEGTPIVP